MGTGTRILVVDDDKPWGDQIAQCYPGHVVCLTPDRDQPDWTTRLEEQLLSQLAQGCLYIVLDLYFHELREDFPLGLRLLRLAHEAGHLDSVNVHICTAYAQEAADHLDGLRYGLLDGSTLSISDKPNIPTLTF